MCKHGTETVVDLPDWVHPEKGNRSVGLDLCITSTIQALWKAGIDTLGCCCGHGKENPSVVIPSNMDTKTVQRAVAAIKAEDNRTWRILQWQLITAATTNQQLTTTEVEG